MRHELIHINGFMYAVGDIPNAPYIICWPSGKQEVHNSNNGIANSRRRMSYRIVATNDPSLNLPLLPAVEEDADIAALKILGKAFEGTVYSDYWRSGYKAASAKEFTEEDVENAMFKIADWVLNNIGNPNPESKKEVDKIIQSLRPKPVAVELETGKYCVKDSDCEGLIDIFADCPNCEERIKVDENNFVKVKQWYYE